MIDEDLTQEELEFCRKCWNQQNYVGQVCNSTRGREVNDEPWPWEVQIEQSELIGNKYQEFAVTPPGGIYKDRTKGSYKYLISLVIKHFPNRWVIPINMELFVTDEGKEVNFAQLYEYYPKKVFPNCIKG